MPALTREELLTALEILTKAVREDASFSGMIDYKVANGRIFYMVLSSNDLNLKGIKVMTQERWENLMNEGGELTAEEAKGGWHWCPDWDGLLVGPGMGELRACACQWEEPGMNEFMQHLREEMEKGES